MNPPPHPGGGPGWIEVICGSMFSGKSEELIRRLRRAQIARQEVAIFKPRLDDRYDENQIVSHSQLKIPSIAIDSAQEVVELAGNAQVIGIDEVQFFDSDIVTVAEDLARRGRRVIAAGLDTDFRGRPFEPIPDLLAVAEYITKALAICVVCGGPGNRTQRTTTEGGRILVGAAGTYEARCRHCFVPPAEEST